jgi:hypothetical protein
VKQGHQAELNMEEHDQKPGSPEASDTQGKTIHQRKGTTVSLRAREPEMAGKKKLLSSRSERLGMKRERLDAEVQKSRQREKYPVEPQWAMPKFTLNNT